MDYPTYDPASPATALTEEELAGLDTLLQTLPADGAMTLDGMDGYLTALLVGPPLLATLPTSAWLPGIWGGDAESGTPAPFASNQKRKRTTVLVLRHLRSIAATLAADPAQWEPIFSVAEAPPGDDADAAELADATDWCTGFLAATDLDPAAWAPFFADAELGPALNAIAWLGGDAQILGDAARDEAPGDDELDDPRARDELSRAAADAVLLLWARRQGGAA